VNPQPWSRRRLLACGAALAGGDSTSHSLHLHGVHPAAMDGIEPVLRRQTATYEVDLPTAGLYPYHCHVAPVAHHTGKGMFGLLVVDPIPARPPAKAWLSPEELEQRQKQL
jgi:FtsP/CotA-like multicopper oxidase with cupredoxin domain